MKIKRNLNLIADFENGYAKNWYFAVGAFFQNSLDIKYTKRIIQKKTTYQWTQGPFYSFGEGHIIYDTPKAYQIWDEALKYINYACRVISGQPASLNNDDILIKGAVHFSLLKNNKSKKLEPQATYHTTQKEFILFLKTGQLITQKYNLNLAKL